MSMNTKYNTSYTVYILPIQYNLFNFGMNVSQQMFNLQIIHIIQSKKAALYTRSSFTYSCFQMKRVRALYSLHLIDNDGKPITYYLQNYKVHICKY